MSSLLILNLIWQITTLALVSLGLAIIFGQLKLINLAHGEFVMLGAYAAVVTQELGLPMVFQIPICIITVGLIAMMLEYTIIRHLYGRLFDSLLATWAIGILLREFIIAVFGRNFRNITVPIEGTTPLWGTDYPTYRLVLIPCIIIFFLMLYLWYRKSSIGMKIKAMVENPDLAASMGINVARLSRHVFIFGAICTAFSGLLLASTVRVDPFMGIDFLLRSFFALVVGGLGSIEGLLLGSGVIAGLQGAIASYSDQVTGSIAILVLAILFLWKKPGGIISAY